MIQHSPFVTVLMPCKDAKVSFFQAAVGSVLNQTTSLWNLIIVDDHSVAADTIDFLNKLRASQDQRIAVHKSFSQQITGAYNSGMRLAKTSYACSLHCDDLLYGKAIETLNDNILRYPEVDYFHSSRIHIDESGNLLGRVFPAREVVSSADFKDRGPVKPLHCWKIQSALAIGGMDESLGLHGADDYDFSWSMFEAGFVFKAVPECLYYPRDHREHYRLTTHVPLDVQLQELKKIWKKHGLTELEIEEQIGKRTTGYLQQALYLDGSDKDEKDKADYDIRSGWRQKYS